MDERITKAKHSLDFAACDLSDMASSLDDNGTSPLLRLLILDLREAVQDALWRAAEIEAAMEAEECKSS